MNIKNLLQLFHRWLEFHSA